jgi:hypothetical protein
VQQRALGRNQGLYFSLNLCLPFVGGWSQGGPVAYLCHIDGVFSLPWNICAREGNRPHLKGS